MHGGARFFEPTLITPLVEINIDELSVLAPLHNPANLQGIVAAKQAFPDVPHVAVFDTAFHQTLPPAAYTYAIDAELAASHRIRRYGFHGTSHKFVSEAAAAFVGRPLAELRQIVFHLGNGASVTAIDGGRSVETSMGLTPLEGLVMGTRSGDIDPAALFHLARRAGMSIDDLDDLLNKRSGMLGLAGVADMRDIELGVERGDAAADARLRRLHPPAPRVRGRLSRAARRRRRHLLHRRGRRERPRRPRAARSRPSASPAWRSTRSATRRAVAASGSSRPTPRRVTVLVVPTNEELEIARQTLQVAQA